MGNTLVENGRFMQRFRQQMHYRIKSHTMKKTLLYFALLIICEAKAQTPLPYQTGFDSQQQQTGWTQYRKGYVSQFQEWDFDNFQSFSPTNSLVHYYPVGGSDTLDDWFVSPPFDLSGGGTLDSLRYYFSGFGVPNDLIDKVYVYLLNGSADPELATAQLELHRFDAANYQNDNTWRLLNPVILPPEPGSSYLAFRYVTVNNWLDVRFDNIAISGIGSASFEEPGVSDMYLFPNPADQNFSLITNGTGFQELSLYDATGRKVVEQVVEAGNIDCSWLQPGSYHYTIVSKETQKKTSGKLVIIH